ncbi:hypothetical protein PLIIFM63780_009907 [Purpureocillium lilacinum]|nr:hypothetical protein PLIIFM63780_009907 [Purpureocillium lilacinum]
MASPKIKAVSWGRMEIPDVGDGKDFKLWPGGGRDIRPGIQIADVEELVVNGATAIVLSRGFQNKLRVEPAVLEYLADKNVSIYIAETREAVTIYSKLAETTPVGGLFHSTC